MSHTGAGSLGLSYRGPPPPFLFGLEPGLLKTPQKKNNTREEHGKIANVGRKWIGFACKLGICAYERVHNHHYSLSAFWRLVTHHRAESAKQVSPSAALQLKRWMHPRPHLYSLPHVSVARSEMLLTVLCAPPGMMMISEYLSVQRH